MNSVQMNHAKRYRGRLERQQGAALITGLILLIVMTLIAVTGMQTTTLEEKMAGNMRNQDLAFQASEAGLRDGEALLSPANISDRPETCSSAPCNCTTSSCNVWEQNLYDATDFGQQIESWWTTNGQELGTSGTQDLAEVKEDPRYIIQELEFKPDSFVRGTGLPQGRHYYRITARGKGGTDTSVAIVESTYTRRF